MTSLFVLWFLSLLAGSTGYAFARRSLAHLPDGGCSSARLIGLLAWAALLGLPWSLGLWQFDRATCLLAGALLVALAIASALRDPAELAAGLRKDLPAILTTEAVFAAALLLFAFLLSHYPDVHPEAMERFQDFALVQGIERSPDFPVEDPWFAGEPLAYYFFGHFLAALLQKVTAADPFNLFNPTIALVHALLTLGAFGLGWNLTGRRSAGALAAFLMVFCGSLWPLREAAWMGAWRPIEWFGAARAIPGAVTEFPAFTALYGDLHAHVIAQPIFVLSASLALAWLTRPCKAGEGRSGRSSCPQLLVPAVGGLSVGCLLATSTLDGLVALAFWLLGLAGGVAGVGSARRPWRDAIVALALVVGGAGGLAYPFAAPLLSQGRGLALVTERSPWLEFWTHFGIPLALLLVGLASFAWSRWRRDARLGSAGGLVALSVVAALLWEPAVFLAVLLATTIAVFVAARSSRDSPEIGWTILASTLGVASLLVCELVYVEASYGPSDLGRTVTTSKLYLDAWLLLGASNAAFIWRGMRRSWRAPLALLLAPAVLLGSLYPVLGALSRTYFFRGVRTMRADGHLARTRPEDAQAVEWLRDLDRRPVLLEATGDPYTWAARLSTLSGGVAVLGWTYHEASWRDSWEVVQSRRGIVDRIYSAELDRGGTEAVLDDLGVTHVVVSDLERDQYAEQGLEWLVAPYERAFEAGDTVIYRRPKQVRTMSSPHHRLGSRPNAR